MNRRIAPLLAAAVLLMAGAPAWAADQTQVHGIQLPAWAERDGQVFALHPGMTLQSGDNIHTGAGGRVLLDLPEGSAVKLGEQASMQIPTLEHTSDAEGGLFHGVLHVLKGAFRFTTSLLGKAQRRDVTIRVGVVTAGIRGTDVWGKSDDQKDMIILLEGQAEMSGPGHGPEMMTTPMQYMMMPKGETQASMEMLHASDDQMQGWIAETDMHHGDGMMMMEGEWDLVVMSLQQRRYADDLREQLNAAGYAAVIEQADVDGVTYHRVVFSHMASVADARRLGEELQGRFGIGTPWVKHR